MGAEVLLIGSAISSLAAGNLQRQNFNNQAEGEVLNSRIATLQGKERAREVRKDLDIVLAGQKASNSARGILAGHGSAFASAQYARDNAGEDIDAIRFNSSVASNNALQRASSAKISGKAAFIQGISQATGSLYQAGGTG